MKHRLMIRRRIRAAVLLSGIALAVLRADPVAAGQTLFVNKPLLTNDLGFFSDARWPEWQADEFLLTGGPAFSLTGIAWWGRYFRQGQAGAVTPEGSDDFVVRLYETQGGNPVPSHFLELVLGPVPRQYVLTSSKGVPLFRWEVSLASPVPLEANKLYAVSIFNRGGRPDDPVFAVLWSTPANWGDARWRRTSESAAWQMSGYNFAFELKGEVVPEPSGLLVLTAGTALLARCRRR
jgi:hypothetical protein